jgi:hypothetical protein
MSACLSVCPSVSQSGPDRTVCLSVCLDLYLCQCFLLSVIRAAFIAAMPPLYPDGQAVHPVCQTAIQIGVARQDPNWRCPPSCQHCWHMGRPRIIPTTPMPMPNGPPPMAKRQLAAVATGSDASGPSNWRDINEWAKRQRKLVYCARMQAACDKRASRQRELTTEDGRTARRERLAARKARRARRRPVPGCPGFVFLNSDDDPRTSSSSATETDGDPPASSTMPSGSSATVTDDHPPTSSTAPCWICNDPAP